MRNFLSSILSKGKKGTDVEKAQEKAKPADKAPETESPDIKQDQPSYVRIPGDELKELQQLNNQVSETKYQLGQMLANFEAEKKKLLQKIEDTTEEMQTNADELRKRYGIPEGSADYLLNLPNADQEFGAFIHKGEIERQRKQQAHEGSLSDGQD